MAESLSFESLMPPPQDSDTFGMSRPIATPREAALGAGVQGAQGDVEGLQGEQLQAQARANELAAKIARQKAEQDAALARQDAADAEAAQAGEVARQVQVGRARSRLDDAEETAKGMQLHDYFEGKHGTAKALVHGLSMLMGTWGQNSSNMARIMMGQAPDAVNTVAPMLNKIVDHDFELQKAKAAKARDDAQAAGLDLERVDRMSREHELALEAGRIKAKEAMVKRFAAQLAQSNLPLEEQQRRLALLAEKTNIAKETREFREKERQFEAGKRATQTSGGTRYSGPGKPQASGVYRDPDTGEVIGLASNPRQGTHLEEEDAKLGAAIRPLEEYKAFLDKHGTRNLSPELAKEAERLRSAAVISVASTSTAGQNEKALEHEEAAIGKSGAATIGGLLHDPVGTVSSYIAGANPKAVEDRINELKLRRQQLRQGNVTPLPGAGKAQQQRPGPGAVIEAGGKHYRVAGDGKTLIEVH